MKHTNGLLRFAALLMTAVVLLSMIPALSASAADRTFKDEIVAPFKQSLDYAQEKGLKNFVIDLSLPDATAFSLSG